MKRLVITGIDSELERCLRLLSAREGISLSQAALRLTRAGAGIEVSRGGRDVVGSSLDELIGTWSDEEAREFREAIGDLKRVDESDWS